MKRYTTAALCLLVLAGTADAFGFRSRGSSFSFRSRGSFAFPQVFAFPSFSFAQSYTFPSFFSGGYSFGGFSFPFAQGYGFPSPYGFPQGYQSGCGCYQQAPQTFAPPPAPPPPPPPTPLAAPPPVCPAPVMPQVAFSPPPPVFFAQSFALPSFSFAPSFFTSSYAPVFSGFRSGFRGRSAFDFSGRGRFVGGLQSRQRESITIRSRFSSRGR